MELESKPTQVAIKDIKVVDFFDNKFVGIMKKKLPQYNFIVFGLYKLNEECKPDERVMIFEKRNKDTKKDVVTVDTDDPETLKKMMESIKHFYKDK